MAAGAGHRLTAARAADDPSDQLALVAALRLPLFGCGDDDLWTWVAAGGRLHLYARADVDPAHPVASALEWQGSDTGRVAEAALPETDTDTLRS